jgi:hypothetical protein
MHNNFSVHCILLTCCCLAYDVIKYFLSQNVCTVRVDTISQPAFLIKIQNMKHYWECVCVCVCVHAHTCVHVPLQVTYLLVWMHLLPLFHCRTSYLHASSFAIMDNTIKPVIKLLVCGSDTGVLLNIETEICLGVDMTVSTTGIIWNTVFVS